MVESNRIKQAESTRLASPTKAQQSRWLRRCRQTMKLEVKELAQKLGVSQRTINSWENENNSNLPARDKLFVYLEMLVGERTISDPRLLAKLGNVSRSGEELNLGERASGAYAALSRRDQRVAISVINALLEES